LPETGGIVHVRTKPEDKDYEMERCGAETAIMVVATTVK
jgi:RecG-like helicase